MPFLILSLLSFFSNSQITVTVAPTTELVSNIEENKVERWDSCTGDFLTKIAICMYPEWTLQVGTEYTITYNIWNMWLSAYGGVAATFGPITYSNPNSFDLVSDDCSNATGTSSKDWCKVIIKYTPTRLGSDEFEMSFAFNNYYSVQNVIGDNDGTLVIKHPKIIKEAAPKCEAKAPGSIIGLTKQSLSEQISIVGTPFILNYSSDYTDNYTTIQSSLTTIPEFNRHLWTISTQHFFQKSNSKLFRGDGKSEVVKSKIDNTTNEILIVSSDGNEIFVFDFATGIHKRTISSLTGATIWTFTYSANRLDYIDDAFGNRTTFNYNSFGVMTSILAPFGQLTTFTVNSSNQLSSVTNPAGNSYHFTYKTGTDLLESFTKPEGQVSIFSYDTSGRLTQDLGNGGNKWTITKTGTDASNTISQVSNLGRATSFTVSNAYGVHSRTQTDPSGLSTTFTENDSGSTKSNYIESNSTSAVVDERFGELHRRTSSSAVTIDANSKTTNFQQYIHHASGVTPSWFNYKTIKKTTTTNTKTWTSVFDLDSLTKIETSPEGATIRRKIDTLENLIENQIGNDKPWYFVYDSNGRLINEKQGLSQNSKTYAYNSSGFISSISNGLNETTTFSYDLAGRVTSITLPDMRVILKTYDANGNLTSITPPGRPAHSFLYNAFETASSYNPPSIGVGISKNSTFSYNSDKQLTLVTLPDSSTIGYTYDASTGKLITKTVPTGNYSYQYDSFTKQLGKIISPNGPASVFEYYGYQTKADEQRRNSDNYLFGKVIFNYDNEHRIISRTTQPSSSNGASTIDYFYDHDDQPTQIGDLFLNYSFPSGRLHTTTIGNISDLRTYDAYGNLLTYTATYTPTGTVLYSYTLLRDKVSRIVGKSENVLGVNTNYYYSFDSAGRLTAVSVNGTTTTTFNYDDNSNRTSGVVDGVPFTATYDDQDRILTYNSRSYSHNNNGYLISTHWSPTSSTSYLYDVMGNLTQATLPSGAVHTFAHDGLDRRVTKSIGGTLQWRILYENKLRPAAYVNNTTGVLTKEFIYATKLNVPDYMTFGGNKYRIITDHLGSPRLIAKITDGTIAQKMDYNVLGEVKGDSNPNFQPFGFAGGIYEPGVQFVRFGARDYDPRSAGRWVSKDPIGFDGGDTNIYGYVLADPVNFVDQSGTGPTACAVVVDGFIVYNVAKYNQAVNEARANHRKWADMIDSMNICETEKDAKKLRNDKYLVDRLKEITFADYMIPSLTEAAIAIGACLPIGF